MSLKKDRWALTFDMIAAILNMTVKMESYLEDKHCDEFLTLKVKTFHYLPVFLSTTGKVVMREFILRAS